MTVRIGDVTFADWVSLKYEGGYTDTFIFHVDALNGLPPFGYRPLLQRLVAHLNMKRRGASLWIQVDSPGEWYLAEVKRAILPGLQLPYVVTRVGDEPDYRSFSYRPKLFHSSLHHPPIVVNGPALVSQQELKCLRVLGRIVKGDEGEIASLAGIPEEETYKLLDALKEKKLVVYKVSPKIQKDKSRPVQMDESPLWHTTKDGMSIALRSWGVPNRMAFNSRKEGNLHLIGTLHRNISRRWPAWLKSTWPHTEIWAGWSEVRLPEVSVLPDGLAWGRIQGFETLLWLEVGDEHKSREQIEEITKKRLDEAWEFCQKTGVRLVYTQLSVDWVLEAACWAFGHLPPEVAVVMGNMGRFGELSTVEWGKLVV